MWLLLFVLWLPLRICVLFLYIDHLLFFFASYSHLRTWSRDATVIGVKNPACIRHAPYCDVQDANEMRTVENAKRNETYGTDSPEEPEGTGGMRYEGRTVRYIVFAGSLVAFMRWC